jgi:outer membrane protein assembly factor BamB
MSGQGIVYCYDGNSGDLIWSVDLLKKFNAENIEWGMAESPLIDGNIIFCTPGGKKNNVVALNRFDGETIWTSSGNHQPSAYCSPILVNHNNSRLIITNTAESVIGVDAETGEPYWNIEQRQQYGIHANTPIYYRGRILCSTAEYDSGQDGTVQIQLSKDGKKAEVKWRNESVKNLINGYILKDGFVYGSPFNASEWYCLNWETGKVEYITKALDSGAIIYADGLFYCYSHKGEMALVDADRKEFKVISSFKVPLGTKQHWAHPVIDKGRLYIRHGDALMVYDIAND